ncbi:protein FAM114A2-like [Daphnia carinata]|uniref:protein FAM114A2-like n=1 Tax=Daphnia carinata TaxID=120202 RepID=UPI00257FB3D0|nr:protein FAM114A2-like [Daphnia carinata]
MSKSDSDDDEFESADEGDESTDESCTEEECTTKGTISAVQTGLSNEKEEILKVTDEDKPVAAPELTGIIDPPNNSDIPVCFSEEFPHHKELQDVKATSVEDQIVHTHEIPQSGDILNKISPGDALANQEDQKNETTELQDNVPTNFDTDLLPKTVDKTIPSIEQICEDAQVPSEIAKKISTRNISNRGKVRSKPTLGAKKLGAVKLSQPPESPNLALSETDSKAIYKEVVTSSAQQTSTSSNPNPSDDGWGWFAPPKSLMSSVASLTNQILSTVENGLNIPEPEDLAKEDLLFADKKCTEVEDQIPKQPAQEEKPAGFTQLSLFGGVSNITKFVESTGSSLFSTGLDTLELLGKKTINVLQQSDPGLKRTKAVLVNPLQGSHDRPCLSQILREAKEISEVAHTDSSSAKGSAESVIPKFTALFELHNGIVHLEALEMLSQQCQNRVAPQIRRLPSQRKAIVDEIAVLCSQTDDTEDNDNSNSDVLDLQALEQNLSSCFDRISLELSLKKLMNAFRDGMSDSVEVSSSLEVYRRALDSLALVTSLAVELFHKGAELTLMASKPSNPAIGARLEAETFQSVTNVLAAEISKLGSHHANKIIWVKDADHTNYSTDIYYEASNCRAYLENALKLMIPILQSRVF